MLTQEQTRELRVYGSKLLFERTGLENPDGNLYFFEIWSTQPKFSLTLYKNTTTCDLTPVKRVVLKYFSYHTDWTGSLWTARGIMFSAALSYAQIGDLGASPQILSWYRAKLYNNDDFNGKNK